MAKRFATIIALPLFLHLSALAESDFAVKLDVSGEFESEITSFMSRELRDLKDVRIVEDGKQADYIISVVGFQPVVNRVRVGYTVSFVVFNNPWPTKNLEPFRHSFEIIESPSGLRSAGQNIVRMVELSSGWGPVSHILAAGPAEHLKRECEGLIAKFDTEQLEPTRRFERTLDDEIR